MKLKSSPLIFSTTILITVGIGVWLMLQLQSKSESTHNETTQTHTQKSAQEIEDIALSRAQQTALKLRFIPQPNQLVNDPTNRSTLSQSALVLDNPNATEPQIANALFTLLYSLKHLNQNQIPEGLNVEITNALLGKNPRKIGYIPVDIPYINKYGQLIDKQGSPFWIHLSPQGHLEITAAGSDRRMHTEDDIVYEPTSIH